MGTLHRFSPKANSTCIPAGMQAQSAKILLFTGVRYERRDEDQKPLRKIGRARKGR